MSRPPADIIQQNWRHLAGLARIVWDDLTLDEVIKSGGDAQTLIGLVEKRYCMTHDEASKQVMSFFERHRNT